MAPWDILYWQVLIVAWVLAFPIFGWIIYRTKWRWNWGYSAIVFLWVAVACVLYFNVVPSSPVTAKKNPKVYERLLKNLASDYIKRSYSHGTNLYHLHNRSKLATDHPIRIDMETLNVTCVLYVHDLKEDDMVFQGLLVAGKGSPTFGDAVIKSYKYQSGFFSDWSKGEYPKGLDFGQWRKSYLRGGGMYCTGGFS